MRKMEKQMNVEKGKANHSVIIMILEEECWGGERPGERKT